MKQKNFIAILGPDGSGKTTVASRLCQQAEHIGFSSGVHRSSNFEILPTFTQIRSRLSGRCRAEPRYREGFKGIHSGMAQQPNSWLVSLVLLLWYSLDLNLGRAILRRARSCNQLICFARYYYDYYFQIANSRLPNGCIRLVEFVIPKPDLVFVLQRAANEIYWGKPELTVQEIERQQAVIRRLGASRENFVEIDASDGIEQTVAKIVSYLR